MHSGSMLMVFGVDRNHTGTGEEDISQANFYGGGRGGKALPREKSFYFKQ